MPSDICMASQNRSITSSQYVCQSDGSICLAYYNNVDDFSVDYQSCGAVNVTDVSYNIECI